LNPAYEGALSTRSDIFLFLSHVPLPYFCKTAEFTHAFLLLHIQWEVFFRDVCFLCDFPCSQKTFLSVLVMYTHVKVDKAVISSLWPHVAHEIYVCKSRAFPDMCNLCPILRLNDKFFSDLLNCGHIVKFGEQYLTCMGLMQIAWEHHMLDTFQQEE